MLLTTAAAMFVTGAQRLKFNEAVSRGHYECAPSPDGHNYRMFDDAALIGLFVFARMTEDDDVPPRLAGRWACEVERVFRKRPDLEHVFFAQMADAKPAVFCSIKELAEASGVLRSRHFGTRAMLAHMQTAADAVERTQGAPLV